MLKRSHPFRFVRRSSTRGLVYYVVYDHDPARPKSTGVLVNPSDKKRSWQPAGYEDAVAWAYANIEQTRTRSNAGFRQFAKDFFLPEKCLWTRRMIKKNRNFGAEYLPAHRGRLVNYMMPRFGPVPLYLITAKMIDEWLMDLDSVRTGLPLAPASLDNVLAATRKILLCFANDVTERGLQNLFREASEEEEKIVAFCMHCSKIRDKEEKLARTEQFTSELCEHLVLPQHLSGMYGKELS